MRTVGSTLLSLAFLLLSGCEQIDFIEIAPKDLVLRQKNNQIWLQAHAKSHTGTAYPKTTVNWSVKDPSVAVVDETGKLTPVKSGATEVVAQVGKVTASAPVQVLFAEKIEV